MRLDKGAAMVYPNGETCFFWMRPAMVKLSPRLAAFAAAYAGALRAKGKNLTPPILPTAPDFFCQRNTNYAHSTQPKKSNIAHFPTSKEREDAIYIIKWCMAIPKIAADSSRFAYYVSRWDIPGKIAAARSAGTLDALLKDCPPIDPSWIRFVPAALEQHREFMAKTRPAKPATNSRESSPRLRRVV